MRRRPKRLTAAPALFGAGGTVPLVLDLDGYRGDGEPDGPVGGQGRLVSSGQGARRGLDELLTATPDPEVVRMAQRIARRLSLRRRARDPRAQRGSGALVSVPYRYRSDDIDLDRTIEVLTERPVPEDTDIVVRERMRSRRDVVLIVDVSGSMRGEKVRTAAATVGALSADLAGDRLAVVAFWSDAALITGLDDATPATRVLDRLLRVPAKGLTDVAFGLTVAHAELARSTARRRVALLLTDAVHNAGPDPRTVARRFGELHVLLSTDGEHDAPLAADLARLGRGRWARLATHRDVAPALNRILRS